MFFNRLSDFSGTRSRGRTGTTLLSLVFETNASTDSAIRADLRFLRRIGWTKIEKIPRFQEFSANYFPAGPFPQSSPTGAVSVSSTTCTLPTGSPTRSGKRPPRTQNGPQQTEQHPADRTSPADRTAPNWGHAGERPTTRITSRSRNRPAHAGPGPDRSVPTTPRDSPHGPSPPCGSDAAASQWSSPPPLRSAPVRCG